jgi:polysaccharide biosynthesis protein PslH
MRVLAVAAQSVIAEQDTGGSKRPWHLIRGLERHGITTVLWSIAPPDDRPAPERGRGSIFAARALLGRPRRTLADKMRAIISPLPEEVWMRPTDSFRLSAELAAFDAVLLMGPLVAGFAGPARAAGVPVVLDAHDVPDRLFARIARTLPGRVARWRTRVDGLKWRPFQRRLVAASSLVVAVSDIDAAAFRSMATTPVVVRPNGVDVTDFKFIDHTVNRHDRLLLTGHFGYLPNIDAARWLSTGILAGIRARRPDASLHLAGRDLARRPWPAGVTTSADVLDIRPAFDDADVFVAPLRAGGGTRLKILEAFAKGVPVVATSIGCEGLAAVDGEHLLVADSADAIVAAALRLLEEEELRRFLAGNARRLVEQSYDWRAITDEYAVDLARVVAERGGRA